MRHLDSGRRFFARPSPALVISIIALVFAAAGTGYAAIKLPANSVGTKQIKNRAVTAAKVKGDLPSAGVAGLTIRSTSQAIPAGSAGAETMTCGGGLVAIGGGMEAPHTLNTYLIDSHPTAAHGWEIGAANAGSTSETVNFSIVCVKGAPGTPRAASAASDRMVTRPLP